MKTLSGYCRAASRKTGSSAFWKVRSSRPPRRLVDGLTDTVFHRRKQSLWLSLRHSLPWEKCAMKSNLLQMKVKQACCRMESNLSQSGITELERISPSNDFDIFWYSPECSVGRFAVSRVRRTRCCKLVPVTLFSSTSNPFIVYFGRSICQSHHHRVISKAFC